MTPQFWSFKISSGGSLEASALKAGDALTNSLATDKMFYLRLRMGMTQLSIHGPATGSNTCTQTRHLSGWAAATRREGSLCILVEISTADQV